MVTHILVRVGCLQPALTPECPVVEDGALLRAAACSSPSPLEIHKKKIQGEDFTFTSSSLLHL
jgi:hypothetical protein